MTRIHSTRRRRQYAVLVLMIVALVLAPAASERATAQSPAYHATPLVAGPYSWATDINDAGDVVGGFYAPELHAFRSEDGLTVDLGGGLRLATAINGAGQIVGWSNVTWRDGAFVDLGVPSELVTANGVNDSGQVVGAYYPPGFDPESGSLGRAFLWQNGVTIDLGSLDGSEAVATGINASGQIVGYALRANGAYHAFLWEQGVMTDLGTLGDDHAQSAAYAINDSGQIVGFSETFSSQCTFTDGSPRPVLHPVLWDHGVVQNLQPTGCRSSVAYDINNVGQIVGQFDPCALLKIEGFSICGGSAFLYSNGAMTELSVLVPHGLWFASAINDRGQIAVSGPGGSYRLDLAFNTSCTTPDPFVALGGGTCSNGGWLPLTMPPPLPKPPVPVIPPPATSCATPDPFVSFGGGTCYNGGWLPPGIAAPVPTPVPTPPPAAPPTLSPPPPGPPSSCATPDPFVAMGGGTCSNGGWYPPGMLPPTAPPAPTPAPATGSCSTPDPFITIPGLIGLCVNGGWIPIIRGS